mgnify:CR=1 FL=1
MNRFPGETEITSTLRRFVTKAPNIAFLTGSGEPSIYRSGDKDFSRFSVMTTNRNALINQGYDVVQLNLNQNSFEALKDTADVLVLTDPKVKLSEENSYKLLDYIESGGNMLITVEPGREDNVEILFNELGIHSLPGVLVFPEQDFAPTLISSLNTNHSIDLSFYFRFVLGRPVTMPTAVGLDFELGNKYEVIPVTTTPVRGAWNEVESTDFLLDTLRFNKDAGEVQRIIPTSFALTRMVNGNEQRIFVVGDTDCLGNAELTSKRAGIDSGNEYFVKSIFNWLTYEQVPVNVRRQSPPDNKIYMSLRQIESSKALINWGIPVIFALIGISIFILRKRN